MMGEPCEEISLEKHFEWAGREWYIPSVYTCEKGMVADVLMRVDSERFCTFMDKWGVTLENEHTFSKEQRRQMELENPLGFHFRSDQHINGYRHDFYFGTGIVTDRVFCHRLSAK